MTHPFKRTFGKLSRQFVSGAISLSLVLAGAVSAQADAWVPSVTLGQHAVGLQDSDFQAGGKASWLEGTKITNGHGVTELCSNWGEGACDLTTGNSISAHLILGVCQGDEVNCIQSVSVFDAKNPSGDTKFLKNVDGPVTAGNPALDLPRGSTVSVWQSPKLHDGGNGNYAAWVLLNLSYHSTGTQFNSFTAGITPFSESTSGGMPTPQVRIRSNDDGSRGVEIMNSGPTCVFNGGGLCAHAQDFAPDTRAVMQLRISSRLTGWLKGRLDDPVVSVTTLSEKINLVTVEASPTKVETLLAAPNPGEVPAALETIAQGIFDRLKAPKDLAGISWLYSDATVGQQLVGAFRDFMKDKATAYNTYWAFSSIQGGGPSANSCLSDTTKLLGLVTTNALAYEGGPPRFEDGFLKYSVSGMHFMADGSIAEGTYNLIVRSEVARCLYKFTSAPISATVSVTTSDGQVKAATTSFIEKDGWLKLSALGFTFSDPAITASLTQAKVVIPVKRTTITCVKVSNLKLTKKVTGVNPKCPAGYKKK